MKVLDLSTELATLNHVVELGREGKYCPDIETEFLVKIIHKLAHSIKEAQLEIIDMRGETDGPNEHARNATERA